MTNRFRDKLRMDLDHSNVDYVLDWNKTVITLNSAFIGIFLVVSRNEVFQNILALSVFFMLSIVLMLIAQFGIMNHKKNKKSDKLTLLTTILWGGGWLAFLTPLTIVATKLATL